MRGVTGIFRKGEEQVREGVQAGEKAVEELRGKVDTAVKQALDALTGPAAAAEIDRLQKRVQELEHKIESLSKP